jgi:hypothetical protein
MWNENAPLELLKSLPSVLNEANLARLQSVIDYDKFINSTEHGYDLCGKYAPFCKGCDKKGKTPCAEAYIKMKQTQGYDIKISNEAKNTEVKEEVKPVEQEKVETAPQTTEEVAPVKKRIRIAVARKRS